MSQSQKKVHLVITTPLETVYDNNIDSFTLTTVEGEMTILPEHIPIVVPLRVGQVMVRNEGREVYYAIDGGILEVRDDSTAVILSNRSESADDIDIQRAEDAIRRAEEFMKRKRDDAEIDYVRLERDIAKELNRIKIHKKGNRK